MQGFDGPKSEKKIQLKNDLSFLNKNFNFYIKATGETFSPLREHPALQKKKFNYFFLCLLVIFALLDLVTDPGTPLNPDLIRDLGRIYKTCETKEKLG
jgi:hypothetical protein